MSRAALLICVVIYGGVTGCGGGATTPSPAPPPGGTLNMTFTAQASAFTGATDEYRRLWRDEGARITEALERGAGLNFVGRDISAVVYEGPSQSGNRDTPMLLRASYPAETKKSALVHELGHRLIAQLVTRPNDLDEHRVLNLILYDVWESLWGKEFADQQVLVESAQRGLYDYETAWNWALSLSKEQRASRFADIVRSNRR